MICKIPSILQKTSYCVTHTSPVQARTMQRHEPNSPIRMIAPGKVYRWDYDATHSQYSIKVEGLIIDEHITLLI